MDGNDLALQVLEVGRMKSGFPDQILFNVIRTTTRAKLDVNCHLDCETRSVGIAAFGSMEARDEVNGTIVGVILLAVAAQSIECHGPAHEARVVCFENSFG